MVSLGFAGNSVKRHNRTGFESTHLALWRWDSGNAVSLVQKDRAEQHKETLLSIMGDEK